MEALRSFLAPWLRSCLIVVAGAIVLGGIAFLVHKPNTPYYAQLAAKAAKRSELQKNTGEHHDYTFTGNHTW